MLPPGGADWIGDGVTEAVTPYTHPEVHLFLPFTHPRNTQLHNISNLTPASIRHFVDAPSWISWTSFTAAFLVAFPTSTHLNTITLKMRQTHKAPDFNPPENPRP